MMGKQGKGVQMDSELIQKLKAIKDSGVSYEKMARVFDVSTRTMFRWINGDSGISPAYDFILRQKIKEIGK